MKPAPAVITCADNTAPDPFVVTLAVADVVGRPPPRPPRSNVMIWPFEYPVPAVLTVTVSKNPIPLLPPSITQSRNNTLAVFLSPTKSVYIVTSSVFSKVDMSKAAPAPVLTTVTLACVLESLPIIGAAKLAENAVANPFEYFVFAKPT